MPNKSTIPRAKELVTNVNWTEFFTDCSYETPPGFDSVCPARVMLAPDELNDLRGSYLKNGESTSVVIAGNTHSLLANDGCPLFAMNHNRPYTGALKFSNIIVGAPALSPAQVTYAINQMQQNGIMSPDTLITGPNMEMRAMARYIQMVMFDIHKWKIDLCIANCLGNDPPTKYRWFLASRKNSGLHYRNIGHGYHEVCAMRWDWIIASLSQTMPMSPLEA